MGATDDGSVIELPIELPSSCCAGHFPDRPIVPGVLQLVLAEEALAVADGVGGSCFTAIRRVRFRSPVGPEARVDLRCWPSETGLRFTLGADGRPATDARVQLGELEPLDTAVGEVPAVIAELPDARCCLPHRSPMLLVEGVVELDDHGGTCLGRITADSQLARDGRVPAVAAVELAAQSLALVELAPRYDGGEPMMGYLAGVSDTTLSVSSMPPGIPLLARVRRTASMPPMARADAVVTAGDQEVLRCSMTTWAAT